MTQTTPKKDQFPCLTEVIFEMKWASHGSNASAYDQVFFGGMVGFEKELKKNGFKFRSDMGQPLPWAIAHRFYRSEGDMFPLYQLGQGIFAFNSNYQTYDWATFKQNILNGITALTSSSPIKVLPVQIELKYIDMFDPAFLNSEKNTVFSAFINNETNSKFEFPKFSFSKLLGTTETGRLLIQRDVPSMPSQSQFVLDLGSAGQTEVIDSIRMETKISTIDTAGQKAIAYKGELSKFVDKWLEDSHKILKPFFEEFITKELHQKLKGA